MQTFNNSPDWRDIIRSLSNSSHVVVAVDLDGTLRRTDGSVSDRTRRAIAEAATCGVEVIPCSSQTPATIRRILGDELVGSHAIASNGTIIWNYEQGAPEWQRVLPRVSVGRLTDHLRLLFPGIAAAAEQMDTLHFEPAMTNILELGTPERHGFEQSTPRLATPPHDVNKLILWHNGVPTTTLEHAINDFDASQQRVVTCANKNGSWLELVHPQAGKGAAIDHYARAHQPAVAIGMGDGPNDLPMKEGVDYFFAMSNAGEEVRDAADAVIPSNDDDGVAYVLESLTALSRSAEKQPDYIPEP